MDFKKRKIKFKAWDQKHQLLMRLISIECNKGELLKEDHVLLPFTGLYDKEGDEIYEMDILLKSLDKWVVFWKETHNGRFPSFLLNPASHAPLLRDEALKMKRFGSYFEFASKQQQ